LSVLDSDPRNIQHTSAVSSTAKISSCSICFTDCSMNVVLSKLTPSCMPSGRPFCSSAIAARTPVATATALLPRCFLIPMPCAGSPLMRA
jgi:hypothetical protein